MQRYAPEIEKRTLWHRRRLADLAGRRDYVAKGRWDYLYRAVDKSGNTIDFYLADAQYEGGQALPGQDAAAQPDWKPRVINTDKSPAYAAALAELKKEGKLSEGHAASAGEVSQQRFEADHGKLKQLIRPGRLQVNEDGLCDDQRLRGDADVQEGPVQALDRGRGRPDRGVLRQPAVRRTA